MNVTAYICQNWEKTIHTPDEKSRGIVKMPTDYTVPCAKLKDMFSDFYYWDTYFANWGLMLDGKAEQAEKNLDVMAYFIQHFGYMPNANHLLDRSQPPLFTRGVWDLYQFTREKRVLEKYLDPMTKEYLFFQYDRNTKLGLNRYGTQTPASRALEDYHWLSVRVEEERKTPQEQIDLAYDLLAIAESGWDFTPRFHTQERKFAAREFVHVDLNSLLYDVEVKLAQVMEILGDTEQAANYRNYAQERKEKMEMYMKDEKSGIFYDYNVCKDQKSAIASCASFYPYAVGISEDQEAAKKLLKKLELEFGLSACEYRGADETYLQWDYPCMWPSNVYFAYVGLKRIGLLEDAERIARKYTDTVERCFAQTGSLWEKYDAGKGTVAVTKEYDSQEMMGWTAGVYRFLEEQ